MKHIIRISALLMLLAALGFAVLPRVAAQGSDPKGVNVAAETEAIRDSLQKAMRAYRLGDLNAAFKYSRSAYLDHFEAIEIPLRALDPDLTLDMEYRFADLRTKMQAGAEPAEVETAARTVRTGVDEIDAMFSQVGALAPALAFTSSFTIIFREGLEAVLIIGALMGYLQTSSNRRGKRYVYLGIVLALVATLITWVILRFIISITPVGREIIEAVVSIIAVGMLFWVSFWLVSRLDRQHWMEFLRAKSWAAMASGSAIGLIGVGFTAIFREGFETALFYEVLTNMSTRVEIYVLLGFLVGCGVLAVVAWLILRMGRRLPIKQFMSIAVSVIILLSIFFAGKAVQQLQESGLIPATSLIGTIPRLPYPVADFTGFHPTVETIVAQLVLTLVYITGGVIMWLKQRGRYNVPSAINQPVNQAALNESKHRSGA